MLLQGHATQNVPGGWVWVGAVKALSSGGVDAGPPMSGFLRGPIQVQGYKEWGTCLYYTPLFYLPPKTPALSPAVP